MPPPRKVPSTVVGLERHAEGLYSVELAAKQPLPRFQPGQFLHLALDRYDPSGPWPESRVFSIASAPSSTERLRLTYAVKGAFTARLERELVLGREVWLKLPFGSFRVTCDGASETVLVAGGTGVTPFVAFLEQLALQADPAPVTLFYGARSRRHLVYEPLVRACRSRAPGFRGWMVVEEGDVEGVEGLQRGRLNLAAILSAVAAPTTARFYLSGPPAMIASFKAGLVQQGVPGPQVITDDWE